MIQYNDIFVYFKNVCVFSKLALHPELMFSEEDKHIANNITCNKCNFNVQFSVNCLVIVSNLMC